MTEHDLTRLTDRVIEMLGITAEEIDVTVAGVHLLPPEIADSPAYGAHYDIPVAAFAMGKAASYWSSVQSRAPAYSNARDKNRRSNPCKRQATCNPLIDFRILCILQITNNSPSAPVCN